MLFLKKAFCLTLVIGLIFSSQVFVFAADTKSTPFDLDSLKSSVKQMTDEYAKKELYDTRLIAVNNQLVRLLKEIKNEKVYDANTKKGIETALKSLDKSLKAVNIADKKISVFAKKDAKAKTSETQLDETKKRLDSIRKNLDAAMAHFKLKKSTTSSKSQSSKTDTSKPSSDSSKPQKGILVSLPGGPPMYVDPETGERIK